MEYLKPEPRKKTTKRPLNKMTDKRDEYERMKRAAYKEISKTRPMVCQGCGSKENLSRSHTLSVKHHIKHIGNVKNIYITCHPCHMKVESSRFYDLDCGKELVGFMLELEEKSGIGRLYKMIDRATEENINLPEWAVEIVNRYIFNPSHPPKDGVS